MFSKKIGKGLTFEVFDLRSRNFTYIVFIEIRGEIGEILRTKQSEVVTDWLEDSLFNSEMKLEGHEKKEN